MCATCKQGASSFRSCNYIVLNHIKMWTQKCIRLIEYRVLLETGTGNLEPVLKWNRFSIPNPRCYTVNSIFMTDSDSVFHIVEIIGPCVFFRWCVSLSTLLCFSTESWRRVLAVMSWREMYQCCCSFCCLGTPPSSGIRPHRALPSIRPRRVRVNPST